MRMNEMRMGEIKASLMSKTTRLSCMQVGIVVTQRDVVVKCHVFERDRTFKKDSLM